MNKLSIASAINQSLKQVFCNLKPVFFLCAIPIILISTMSALVTTHRMPENSDVWLQFMFTPCVYIMWMRASYGTDPMPKTFFIFRLGKREWKYLGVMLLWIVAAVPAMICYVFLKEKFEDAFFVPLLAAFIGIVLMIFFFRFSFVWVHISLGNPISFRGSWQESKKVWGRMAIATLVFYITRHYTVDLFEIWVQFFPGPISESSVLLLGAFFVLLETIDYLLCLVVCSIVVLFYKESIAGTKR